MSDKAKYRVLEKIADGQLILDAGRAKKRIGVEVVHYRWNSIDRNRPEHFKFNINNNTLTANWELWICGSEDLYYLLPIEVIKEMYHDPDSYADNTHSSQNIKVVSVNTSNNTVTYASGSKQIDIKAYRDSTLSGNPRTIEPALITSFKFGSSGEQDEHLSLKNWIADNPGFINVTEVVKTEVENHTFPSSDRPDIVFTCSNGVYVTVEIETNNVLPGLYQAAKYRTLMTIEKGLGIGTNKIRTVLVAWEIPHSIRTLCEKYGIEYYEKKITLPDGFG